MGVPHWKELLEWIKPEPAHPHELEWAEKVKPGEYEVYSEKLNNICLEAKEVFIRSGVSSMLRSGDLIVSIHTPAGDMVAAYCGTYLHAASAQLFVKSVVRMWKDNPTVGVKEGDVFYANESLYGGIHNCDQIAMMPVFHEGELIGWGTAAVHQAETGGCDPGGMCPTAKSRYDEGMRLSPIKIGTNYHLRDDLLEMMANMVGRAPRMQVADVRARVTAADRIRIRLQQLVQEKGKEFLWGLFRRMIIDAEEGAKKKIMGWNDGIYRSVVFGEVTAFGDIGLLRFCLTMRKEGDRLIFDFSGTSPENETSWHAFPHIVVAHAAIYIFGYAFADLPVSCGDFVPMEWIVPEGTLLNPAPTAAFSNSPVICHTVMTLCPITFSKMMFDSAQRSQVAAPIGTSPGGALIVAGINQWGVPIAEMETFSLNSFGHGARTDQDGVDSYGFPWGHPGRTADGEDLESEIPILYLTHNHLRDSCGFGKWRGGSGTETSLTPHHVPYAIFTKISTGGSKISVGQGIFGGYPTLSAPTVRVSATDLVEMLRNGDRNVPKSIRELVVQRQVKGRYEFCSNSLPGYVAMQGDITAFTTGGGSGYGDVLERSPDLVMKDLKDEVISHWAAENVYKVVYNHQTLEVDYQRSREARQQERQNRLQKGKSYQEFEKEWLQKKPKDDILKYYGSWPDANKVREIIRI